LPKERTRCKNKAMPRTLTPEIIRRAVHDSDKKCVDQVVAVLTPIIQARLARVLLSRWPGSASSVRVRQDMEDMVQEVFAFLLGNGARRLLAWDPDKGSASTFFGLLAERWLMNMLSSRKRNPWSETPSSNEKLQDCVDIRPVKNDEENFRNLLLALGRQLVQRLSARDLQLFDLMYVQALDDKVVRQRTGLSRDALYQARKRLLERVRKMAGEMGPDFEQLVGDNT